MTTGPVGQMTLDQFFRNLTTSDLIVIYGLYLLGFVVIVTAIFFLVFYHILRRTANGSEEEVTPEKGNVKEND